MYFSFTELSEIRVFFILLFVLPSVNLVRKIEILLISIISIFTNFIILLCI